MRYPDGILSRNTISLGGDILEPGTDELRKYYI